MRLALLAPIAQSIPPRYDGPRERQIALLCSGLVRQGVDVTLFASGDSMTAGQLAAVCPAAYTEDPSLDPQTWESLHMAHLSAQADEFDLIHNHCDTLPLAYSRPLPTPVVTTLYSRPAPQSLPLLQCQVDRNYYVALCPGDRHPDLPYVATVSPGVDLEAFTYQPQPGAYLLLYGSVHAHAGITEARAIAQQCGRPLVIAGPIQDQVYFEANVVPHLDQEHLCYVGPVAADAYNELLGGAYALLQPGGDVEVQRLSAIEALACGTPVVTFAREAMTDIVCHGKTGYVVTDVAEAVSCLAQTPAISRQYCRDWVAMYGSHDRMVDAYVKVYIQLLEQEKARAHHATPPWGHWEVLLDTPTYKVKRLTVWPGERLSYQKHFRREEHWTVVQGEALITLNDVELRRVSGEAIDIPREAWHRLANPGASDLVVIEVQCGDYLGEDDIVRRQDNYGRAKTAVRVDGEVERALTFGFVELAALPDQVAQVGTLIPGRDGSAVRLRALLEVAGVREHATHITFSASADNFSASVPLAAVLDRAVLMYRQGLEPLSTRQGGPVRLFITDVESCNVDSVNACTNVKDLDHIRITVAPEADTL
jgi:mannose-6-phosphate isomerase-like protein (cupin superfamily)/glycosyltransferase involved in cell wall biosynthesis